MLISATEIIKKSWQLYTDHWRDLSVYMLLLFLPSLALLIIGVITVYLTMYLPASALISDILTLIIMFASLLFGLWTSVALMQAVKSLLRDSQKLSWKESFGKTWPLLWPVIFTSILTTLVVVGGLLLLIIPGIIFMVWYLFSVQEVLFDGQRGIGAMRGSKRLVTGRWWSIAWRAAAPTILFVAVSLAIQQILILPFFYLNSAINLQLAQNIISSLINAALTPLTIAAAVILYFSAKETPVPSLPSSPPVET